MLDKLIGSVPSVATIVAVVCVLTFAGLLIIIMVD